MNALAKPQRLPYSQAHNFLQNVILDSVEGYRARQIDVVDFAHYIEANHKSKFVQYVKDRCDWPQIATDDCLVSAEDARTCYESPEKFRELVDEALFRHFQNVLEDWHLAVAGILARHGFTKEVA